MQNPYDGLPGHAFWRSAVAETDPAALCGLWHPRFLFPAGTRVATAGSCFAQNLRGPLGAAGLSIVDTEPAPRGMAGADARRFGYGLFSARCGNIYTARHLLQLLQDALAGRADPADVWHRGPRAVDALRPGVEPEGLSGTDEVLAHRHHHLSRVVQAIAGADVLVFTLGLTETWINADTGRAYPAAPGVLATPPDGTAIRFHNHGFAEVQADLQAVRALLNDLNPGLRLLLTVSPVPLTATAAGGHVLAATAYSKAVLRAAAGGFVAGCDTADYFPSYEIITNPAARGRFFAANLRNVTPAGVAAVMGVFLASQGLALPGASAGGPQAGAAPAAADDDGDPAACEDALLDAFRP